MSDLSIELFDGTIVLTPASLKSITTYVLLEQENWFEKEIQFTSNWLRPGMTIIDIGANLGVYGLSAARKVGPEGRVYAYEPGSIARGLLEKSVKANALSNLEIIAFALSDNVRDGTLFHGGSCELHSLSSDGVAAGAREGDREDVSITSLDEENEIRGWAPPDFVKIDAEGEEGRIVKGGASFFSTHSPLVMFEIKAGEKINLSLLSSFSALGYRPFRSIGAMPLLVPFNPEEPVDGYELNLFAAKPDRISALAAEDFLVETVPSWQPDDASRAQALSCPGAMPYAAAFAPLFAVEVQLDPQFRDCLAGFATWRNEGLPMPLRYAALGFAERELLALCEIQPTLARLSTLARASWEIGYREHAVFALHSFADTVKRGGAELAEPFWPCHPRFDALDPGAKQRDWFLGGTMEQMVLSERFSSFYGPPSVDLSWLESQAFSSAEIARRRVLSAVRAGTRADLPERLRSRAPDHVNAEIWRAGELLNGLNS